MADASHMDKPKIVKNDSQINPLGVSWGHGLFDQNTKGVPASQMSVLESPCELSGYAAMGAFLAEGLSKGEKVALVALQEPSLLMDKFQSVGFDFSGAVREERLFVFSFQPEVLHEMGLSHDLADFWKEFCYLCQGAPARMVLLNLDSLINTNSPMLTNSSAQKISTLSSYLAECGTTVLGHFIHYKTSSYTELSIAFRKTMAAYFRMTRLAGQEFDLQTLKTAWFFHPDDKVNLVLQQGKGFDDQAPASDSAAA